MTKRIFSSVDCVHNFASDYPESFVITVTPSLAARIRQLAAAANDLGVGTISEFNFEGAWSSLKLDGDSLDNADELEQSIESETMTIEIPELHVTPSNFYFTAVPEHLGADMALQTERILLSELDSSEDFLVV